MIVAPGPSGAVTELLALQEEQGQLLGRLAELDARRAELLGSLAGAPVQAAGTHAADCDDEAEQSPEVVMHKGVELGGRVMLDEDVYEGVHTPPRVYVFEEYDSEATAGSNCTLVNVASGDWTVRGIGELVPVDDDQES
ncbi:hypothetical protein NEK97_17160 [Paenarthrobacter sp. UW852]|uniref:hypothetical protein n=1 Tax=Paenarthrobacter sp. UW852 TaxID=2951989 RepID=UPI00214945B7|nr:hypothetical protein [Paenarthrobacter sp. UW852]MCR1163195.1 hypothetical protein [Paenarthrobacter sp. UW852]